jgi:sorbitol-specific phosphotransferase system component IIC
MFTLPMAVPFVVLVVAAVAAMLGFRRTSVWVWFVAAATMAYSFQGHVTDALKIAL